MEGYPISEKDYSENLDLLIAQFKDSENLNGIIEASNNKAQDIETAVFEIRTEFDLDIAVGAQLDILGSIFNEDRDGRNDSDYRTAIKIKGSNQFSGEPESIISIILSSFGATFVVYRPNYDAKYYILTDASITSEDLIPFSPAGVKPLVEVDYIVDYVLDNIVDYDGNLLTSVG
jgi:hypothetical protein